MLLSVIQLPQNSHECNGGSRNGSDIKQVTESYNGFASYKTLHVPKRLELRESTTYYATEKMESKKEASMGY